jgi:hypothetical protein
MAKYIIMNHTDGITATPDLYTSKKKAQEVIDKLRDNFRRIQGYYRTNRMEKISPDDINYQIIKL